MSQMRKGLGNKIDPAKSSQPPDLASNLSDKILLDILARVPVSSHPPISLVCKRWLRLQSSLVTSLRLHEWSYLQSGRLKSRFPNLTILDLTQAAVLVPRSSTPLLLTHGSYTLPLSPDVIDLFPIARCIQEHQLSPAALDSGLRILGDTFCGLQRLALVDVYRDKLVKGVREYEEKKPVTTVVKVSSDRKVADRVAMKLTDRSNNTTPTTTTKVAEVLETDIRYVSTVKLADISNTTTTKVADVLETDARCVNVSTEDSETALAYVARSCPMLQEMELLQCTDEALKAISGCRNLQILRLVGMVTEAENGGVFTDIGLTVLANNLNRLVKLELIGCEASYHGIAAVGQCCIMLEELTLSTRGFQKGWVAALSRCSCLKKLSLVNSKYIDLDPGPAEYLGFCSALDCLKLSKCDLRDRLGFAALLSVCRNVRELKFTDCWGLEDETFGLASKCRRTRLLSLEGCSLVTTSGLEAVIMAWKELQRLRVTFCDSIRDSEVSPGLADCFVSLKEFKWRPDTKSLLVASLAGTGVGQKGGRFFKV